MYTVLLADDNKEWLDVLEIGLEREKDLRIVGKAYNGREAINAINDLRPDIVLLDIIMPEFDGVYIVNHIRDMVDYDPIIYILSGIGTNTIVKILNDLNVDFYSMKPVPLAIITDTLAKIIQCQNTDAPKKKANQDSEEKIDLPDEYKPQIKELLYSLGMPSHLFSTKCMINALSLYMSDPQYSQLLTKSLYPTVAKSFKISSSSVEKNLRTAIAQMQKHQTEFSNELFTHYPNRKISNGEFLSVMAEYIKK